MAQTEDHKEQLASVFLSLQKNKEEVVLWQNSKTSGKHFHRSMIEFVNEHIFTILLFPVPKDAPFSFDKKNLISLYAPKSEIYAELKPGVVKKDLLILDLPEKIIHQKMAIKLPKLANNTHPSSSINSPSAKPAPSHQSKKPRHLRSSDHNDLETPF